MRHDPQQGASPDGIDPDTADVPRDQQHVTRSRSLVGTAYPIQVTSDAAATIDRNVSGSPEGTARVDTCALTMRGGCADCADVSVAHVISERNVAA